MASFFTRGVLSVGCKGSDGTNYFILVFSCCFISSFIPQNLSIHPCFSFFSFLSFFENVLYLRGSIYRSVFVCLFVCCCLVCFCIVVLFAAVLLFCVDLFTGLFLFVCCCLVCFCIVVLFLCCYSFRFRFYSTPMSLVAFF